MLQLKKVGPPKTAAVHSIVPLRIQAPVSSQNPSNSEMTLWKKGPQTVVWGSSRLVLALI